MNRAFEKLTEEKKALITQVCIDEFGSRGYRNASTNQIIERADISKGILFHYFGSKKNLYLFLVKHLIRFFSEELKRGTEQVKETEFFKRVRALLLIQLRTFAPYPNEYRLLQRAFAEPPSELKKEIQELYLETYDELHPLNSSFYARYMAPSRLRSQVQLEQVVEVLSLVFDQLTQKYLKSDRERRRVLDRLDPALERELDHYLEILKYGIYQQGRE